MSADLASRRASADSPSLHFTPEGNTVSSPDHAHAAPRDTPTDRLGQEPPRDEPAAPGPVPPALRAAKPLTEAQCTGCGTTVQAGEIQCAFCVREHLVGPSHLRTTLLHWLVFIVVMTIIIGGGSIFAQ